jgi:ABC-type branched-subunit amino acid transport system substrate-binding protein
LTHALGPALVLLLTACGTVNPSGNAAQSASVSLVLLLPRNSPTDRSDVRAITAGIAAALAAHDYRAGGRRVTLIEGSSSDPSMGTESFLSCPDIAAKYVGNDAVVGVVGPLTDECAIGIVPALAQRGIAVVSPTASAPIFTHQVWRSAAGGCSVGQRNRLSLAGCEPEDFYPRGVRNFAHVVATVDEQGPAAAALFARLGVSRVFALVPFGYDGWMLPPFRREARRLGVHIVGVGKPSVDRPSRAAIQGQARAVVRSGADGLYLVGDEEADPVGRNAGLPPFLAAIRRAGFRGIVVASFWKPNGLLLQRAPRAAQGMYYTSTRLPLTALPVQASALAARLKLSGRYAIDAIYGAAAAEVLLDAIAASDGTRAGVRAALFRTRDRGTLGSIEIDGNGDVVPARVAILRVSGESLIYRGTVTVGGPQ